MQIANALVALGGDRRNTVPKSNITVAEVMVLQAIHGEDSVHEIEIVGDSQIAAEDLRDYLRSHYPAKDEDARLIVDMVFPGRRPDFPQSFSDVEIADVQFKATARATPEKAGPKKRGGGKKTEPAAAGDIFDDSNPME